MQITYDTNWPLGSCACTEIKLEVNEQKDFEKIKENLEKAFNANKGRLILVHFKCKETELTEKLRKFLRTEEKENFYFILQDNNTLSYFHLLDQKGKYSSIKTNINIYKEEEENYVIQ